VKELAMKLSQYGEEKIVDGKKRKGILTRKNMKKNIK
jgi:hypothetical protein